MHMVICVFPNLAIISLVYVSCLCLSVNRGSYMSAHVLLNLLNELRKRDFATSLINSIIQEHEC